MRRLVLITALVLLPQSTAAAGRFLSPLEVDLTCFAGRMGFEAQVMGVRSRTWQYQQLLDLADSLGHANHYQVDIIGQIHQVDNETPREHGEMVISQSRVYCVLDSVRYQLVADEEPSAELITRDLVIQTIQPTESSNSSSDSIDFMIKLDQLLSKRGAWAYLWRHPESIVIGGDDYALNRLHSWALDRLDLREFSTLNEWSNLRYLATCLSRMRSEIALAKTIIALHRHGFERGAIVIGAGHAKDFLDLLPTYGLTGQYFPADNHLSR